MANPFSTAGASADKPSKFAPLLVEEFFTGQYSNSNPLREAAVPLLYRRFYSGNRYDTIRSGANVEISPRLTIIRRPGTSVYNSATFPPLATFYAFGVFDSVSKASKIRVIADSAGAVYDATGPSTQTILFTKLVGSGQTSFQSVGNTLYAADGVSSWKWVWASAWQAATSYSDGAVILDAGNNLQQAQGLGVQIVSTAVLSNVMTVVFTGTATVVQGTNWEFSGMTANPSLNGQVVTIATVGAGTFTATYNTSDYSTLADTGIACNEASSGISGSSIPSFSGTIGAVVLDGTVGWISKGSSIRSTGIVAPAAAPIVSQVATIQGTAWVASTYYWPANGAIILDSNSNIQEITTVGTTGSSVPSWSTTPGNTTADSAGGGTVVWTCRGSGARAISTGYAVGAWIAVTVVTTVTTILSGPRGSDGQTVTHVYNNFYFFQANTGGTTSATTTNHIAWPSTLGGTVHDGTVTWTNVGYQVTRTTSATSSPSATVKGNVGNSTLAATTNSIVDNAGSGGGSGFTQNVVLAGKSGASHPTWAVTAGVEAAGLTTNDNGLLWNNAGPTGIANTGSWVYTFSLGDSVTGHESTAAPLSTPITLATQSSIGISGQGDPNWATDGVDTINIYRSVQGFTTPFRLTQIPAPAQGAPWQWIDATPDPPNPASILNEFISADTVGNNAPPPAGLTNLTYYLNRVFGSTGTFQNFSGVAGQRVGVGAESWPGSNFAQMPEIVTRTWASATGLLIFTTHGVFFSQGVDGNLNPNQPVKILEDVGLRSRNLFTVNGSIPVLLTADGQMLALDPSAGVTRYSDPIADAANGMGGFSTINSYLAWHVNGLDSAFYLADGLTGWFRLCPTASPESGFTWSPKAVLAAGCGAIKSIETSPGVKDLLISTPAPGPILRRDLTLNTDNGTSYAANFVIGSLVLARPHECAEVESFSTYTSAVGSKIGVSVLGNEIAETPTSHFELLATSVPEPHFLKPSSSVFADRWYFSQATQPIWCQHLQIRFNWGAENAQNELLAYSVYGCVHV